MMIVLIVVTEVALAIAIGCILHRRQHDYPVSRPRVAPTVRGLSA
jgi:hypothetical protein